MSLVQQKVASNPAPIVLLAFAICSGGPRVGLPGRGVPRGPPIAHATNAFAVLVLSALSAIFGFNLRLLTGGPSWTFFLPACLLLMAGIQITLGFAGIRGGHVFWGVLYLCTVTAFCSYCWRLKASDIPVRGRQ